MCQPQCSAPSPGYTPFISTKPFLPESVTHHLRVCTWSLCPTLVGASQPESSSHSIFWQPQKGQGCFEGGYHLQYTRWSSPTVRTDPPVSTSTASTQVSRDAKTLPLHGLPSSSPSVVRSPSKCRCAKSPSPQRSQSSTSSLGESLASRHGSRGSRLSSSSSLGSSSGSGSGSESQSGSPARSKASADARSVHSVAASVGGIETFSGDEANGGKDDVLDSANKADVSQGSMSLLDISATDNDDTRKCKARELAHKSDTDFAAWKEKLVSEGMSRTAWWTTIWTGRESPKILTPLAPLFLTWRNAGCLSPCNLWRILWGYVTLPCRLECVHACNSETTGHGGPCKESAVPHEHTARPYIIMVFQGGTVTPLGLLQELHMQSAFACIPIYRSEETKDGHRPCVSCCPFCTYTIQNDPAYLNHIFCMHYNVNLACGTCLNAVTSSGQQMKKHLKECSRLASLPTASQESACSGRSPKKSAPGSKHVQSKKKGRYSEKSRPASQAS